MANLVTCPKCGNEFEVSAAIKQQLQESLGKELELKYKKELEEQKQLISKQVREDAITQVRKEYDSKIEATKESASQMQKQLETQSKEMLDVMTKLREAQDAERKLKLDFQKKLLEEEENISLKAKKEAEEEMLLKMREKEKQLTDAEKQIQDLQRKLKQGSQQTQGEVLELELETMLKQNFLFDEIDEVPKGVSGADVIQKVKNNQLKTCGTIIWELKNTKNWTEGWIDKLKDDQRNLKAEIAILVSSVLPKDMKNFGLYNGIWVCNLESALGIATALRIKLIDIEGVREANKGMDKKAEIVYKYLVSNEFKQRIEVWVEYFKNRTEELNKEKRYFNTKWQKEEKSIQKIMENTAGIYGDLQGLIGNALPQVKSLELGME